MGVVSTALHPGSGVGELGTGSLLALGSWTENKDPDSSSAPWDWMVKDDNMEEAAGKPCSGLENRTTQNAERNGTASRSEDYLPQLLQK